MMDLIEEELHMRASELKSPLESIYFGGGSPSLISTERLQNFIARVKNQFDTVKGIEITLEVNPDDVNGRVFTASQSFTNQSFKSRDSVFF